MDVRVWAYTYTVSLIIPDCQPDQIALLPTDRLLLGICTAYSFNSIILVCCHTALLT
jgi:hypothetical protein